jgi:hypothetical protein
MPKYVHLRRSPVLLSRAPASSVAAFLVTASLLVYYALRGGSYDIVPRQEEAIVLWWLLAIGFATGLLPRFKPPRSAFVPIVAIALLAVWTAISLGWTQSDELTFNEIARYMHYLGLLLLVFSLIGPGTWRAAAGGLCTGAIVVCGLAVASRLDPGAFPTNYIQRDFGITRLSYPFGYWNAVGAWSAMSMTMALAWSAHARLWATRFLALAAVPVCVGAAYMAYSRAAVGGIALGILLVIVLGRNRWVTLVHGLAAAAGSALVIVSIRHHPQIADATGGKGASAVVLACVGAAGIAAVAVALTTLTRAETRWRLPRRQGRIAAALAVLVVVVAVPAAGHAEISKGWHQFKQHAGATDPKDPAKRLSNLNGNRYFIWKSAERAFTHHPVGGTGAGTFGFWWNYTGGGEFLRDAHTIYIEPFAEEGFPGGILTLVLLVGLAVAGVRGRRPLAERDIGVHAALLAAFGVYLLHAGVDWMWESTAVSVLALVGIAVAAAAASGPLQRKLGLGWRVPVTVIAIVAALIQFPGLTSTKDIRASQNASTRGDLQTALSKANDAVDAEPWAATPYAQRGLVEESIGALGAAEADLQRAEKREPTNYSHPLVLARIAAERGDVKLALAAYRRAKELRPQSALLSPVQQ